LEIALFAVFGPDVRIPILLNGVLAVVTAIGIYDLTKLRFGHPAAFVAAAIVAFFPSLILWSALNLKDTLTTVLAVVAVWAAIRFQSRPRPASFALQFAAAEALITLRSYVAATMAIMAFLSISLAALPLRRRVGTSVLAGILTMVIGVQSLNAIGSGFGEQLLLAFERQRAVMAIGARTGFVPTPTPPVTSSPTPVGGSPEPSAPAASTPASYATAGPPTPAAARPDDLSAPPGRTLSYLPTGLAYAIFAPVPLFARRIQEILAAPEMVAWYVLVVAGAATLWRERRRWSELAPLVFAIGGLILVLALAEGNVGTLFRHRAMVIPFAASLASPSLVALWMRRRRTRTMATVSAAGSSVNAD
jgi:4-amino-4-deoxy-L-arabinose transferase-like glycosyltransferase